MSEKNVELARRYCEAFNEGGVEGTSHLRHPDVELHDPPEFPDAGKHVGEVAFAARLESYLALGWDGQVRVDAYIDAGEEVIVAWRMSGQSSMGHAPVVDETFALVFLFKGGEVLRLRQYLSTAEALEAAGLSE